MGQSEEGRKEMRRETEVEKRGVGERGKNLKEKNRKKG